MRSVPLTCRLLGHRWRFVAEDTVVLWRCARNCGATGRREYATAEQARRTVRVLDDSRPGPPTPLLAALSGSVLRRRRR